MIYNKLRGFVSERVINGTTVYCVLERGVYYVTYNSGAVSPPIVNSDTEEGAYAAWIKRTTSNR